MPDTSQDSYYDFRVSLCPDERKHVFDVLPEIMRAFADDDAKVRTAAIRKLSREKLLVAFLDTERRLSIASNRARALERALIEAGVPIPPDISEFIKGAKKNDPH